MEKKHADTGRSRGHVYSQGWDIQPADENEGRWTRNPLITRARDCTQYFLPALNQLIKKVGEIGIRSYDRASCVGYKVVCTIYSAPNRILEDPRDPRRSSNCCTHSFFSHSRNLPRSNSEVSKDPTTPSAGQIRWLGAENGEDCDLVLREWEFSVWSDGIALWCFVSIEDGYDTIFIWARIIFEPNVSLGQGRHLANRIPLFLRWSDHFLLQHIYTTFGSMERVGTKPSWYDYKKIIITHALRLHVGFKLQTTPNTNQIKAWKKKQLWRTKKNSIDKASPRENRSFKYCRQTKKQQRSENPSLTCSWAISWRP